MKVYPQSEFERLRVTGVGIPSVKIPNQSLLILKIDKYWIKFKN